MNDDSTINLTLTAKEAAYMWGKSQITIQHRCIDGRFSPGTYRRGYGKGSWLISYEEMCRAYKCPPKHTLAELMEEEQRHIDAERAATALKKKMKREAAKISGE